jgi:hypothetical protein
MARLKVDGIIEAVRYTSNGSIGVVRAYERRGAAWSDQVLLQRKELVEKLGKGKRFLTGQRKPYLGSLFETGTAVAIIGDHVVSEGITAARDQLAGVPVF